MDTDFANWFVGFVDGEGSFQIQNKRRLKGGYMPTFSLVLRDDDVDVILAIQETLGFGLISARKFTGPGSHDGIGWHVYSKYDLLRLVAFFDEYPLRSKKVRDFAVWREAVWEYQKDTGVRSEDKMAYLYTKLKLVRQYDPPDEIDNFEPDGIQLEFWDLSNG